MKRMTWFREAKWLIAGYLIGWALDLMHKEMSLDSLRAAAAFMENLHNDPAYDVVPMRRARPEA